MRLPLFLTLIVFLSASLAQDPVVRPARLVSEGYRLNVKDKVQVSVFDEPELAVAREISANGSINLPLIGEVTVARLTAKEAEQLIEKEYQRQRYLKRPQVTVSTVTYVKNTVSILGDVQKPGPVTLPEGETRIEFMTAIALAGGFTGTAKEGKVKVTRKGSDRAIEVDAFKLARGDGRKVDERTGKVYLYPGDVVFVPQTLF